MFKIIIGGTVSKGMIDLVPFDIHYENQGDSKIFWITLLFICFYWEM